MAQDKFGLRELPKDKRDFPLGALFALPSLEELPEDFKLEPLTIKNQGNTDYCSAYMSTGMSELQELVKLSPEWSFAKSKEISGDLDEWGQDLRSAMKVHTKYGAVPSDTVKIPSNSRDIAEYEDYTDEATKHIKKSYFSVTGQYDHFDNIRASIYKFRMSRQAVGLGVIWQWSLNDTYLEGVPTNGFGHAIYAIGWVGDYLLVVNSYGAGAGDNGIHHLNKEAVNKFVDRYGAFMMVDMEPQEAKTLLERAEWAKASWLGKLLILFKRLIT
jgi:hypothetical protein